eukprot:gene11995-20318_t
MSRHTNTALAAFVALAALHVDAELVQCAPKMMVFDSFGPATHNHDHSTKWINCRMDNGTSLVIDDHDALGVPAQQFPRRVDVDIQPDGSISSVTLAPVSLAVDVLDDAGVSIAADDDDGASSSLTSGSYANLNGGTDSSSTTAGAGGGRKSRNKRSLLGRRTRKRRTTDDYKERSGDYKMLLIELVFQSGGTLEPEYKHYYQSKKKGTPNFCSTGTAKECMAKMMWEGGDGDDADHSIANMFSKSSYGLLNMPENVGDIVTAEINEPMDSIWETFDYSSATSCSKAANLWMEGVYTLADAAVAAQGVADNPGDDDDDWKDDAYTHRIYMLPANAVPDASLVAHWPADCGWDGVANIIGRRSYVLTWKFGAIAHEVGHNLGLGDAATDEDNDGEEDHPYEDDSSVMGFDVHNWKGVNAPNRRRLGWIPDDAVYELGTTDAAGASTCSAHKINIASLDNDPFTYLPSDTNRYNLAATAAGPTHTDSTSYYISYRVDTGESSGANVVYDHDMESDWTNKVHIHWAQTSDNIGNSARSRFIARLSSGNTYESSDGNLKIKVTLISTAAADSVATVCFYCSDHSECDTAVERGPAVAATVTSTTTKTTTTSTTTTTTATTTTPAVLTCNWHGEQDGSSPQLISLTSHSMEPALQHMVAGSTVETTIKFVRRLYSWDESLNGPTSRLRWVAKQNGTEIWSTTSDELESLHMYKNGALKKYKTNDQVDIAFVLPDGIDYASDITIDGEIWTELDGAGGGYTACQATDSESTVEIGATTLPCLGTAFVDVFTTGSEDNAMAETVCGATKVAGSSCSATVLKVTYAYAKNQCESIGARLCSAEELAADVTKGTGCGNLDTGGNGRLVYTKDECTCDCTSECNEDTDCSGGGRGYYSAPGSTDATGVARCTSAAVIDTYAAGNARCCADVNGIESNNVGLVCPNPPCNDPNVPTFSTAKPFAGDNDGYNPDEYGYDEIDQSSSTTSAVTITAATAGEFAAVPASSTAQWVTTAFVAFIAVAVAYTSRKLLQRNHLGAVQTAQLTQSAEQAALRKEMIQVDIPEITSLSTGGGSSMRSSGSSASRNTYVHKPKPAAAAAARPRVSFTPPRDSRTSGSMSTGSNKSSMRGSVAFPGASFSQAHGAPSFSVQDSSGDDDDEEEVGFPGMASGPSGSISFPGVPDGAGDFVAFPGMGTLQEETE